MLIDGSGLFRPIELPCCAAVTTTRCGGGVYGGFNACHYVGDAAAHVEACRAVLSRYFGVSADCLVIPRQTHSSVVACVSSGFSQEEIEGVDALVTNDDRMVLCINTADCVPVLLVDPVARVTGAVHSGWRGTVSRISEATVRSMCCLGAKPERIVAAMGPAICESCFEVGEEVAVRFDEEFGVENGIVRRERGRRPHVDLGLAVRQTLVEAGLRQENVALPVACSHCPGSEYFSARSLGVASGRTLTAIKLMALDSIEN